MPIRCPLCKADNAVGPACRRCKADLEMLFAIEAQRATALAETSRAAEWGSFEQALKFAEAAKALRGGADVQRWLAVLNLLTDRFGEAWPAYQTTCQHG